MSRKRVTVHYRRLYRTADPPFSELLSDKLRGALDGMFDGVNKRGDFSLRRYEDAVDGASIILNGILITERGGVFGELIRYSPETNISLVMQAAGPIAELEIREAHRPNGADFLRGMCFFMLRGDHLLIIEQDLPAGVLERYLRWFIFTASKAPERDTRLRLVPQVFFNGESGGLQRVSSITLKPPSTLMPLAATANQAAYKVLTAGSAETDVLSLLREAHFDSGVLDRIAGDGTGIKVTINVEFTSGRKKVQISGDDAFDLLRDVPEEELIINGSGLRKNRGVLERLNARVDVEQRGYTLDRKDAWSKLDAMAAEYRSQGLEIP